MTEAGRELFSDPATFLLLKKVFTIDVLACPECSGRMKLIAFVANEAVARHILRHLGIGVRNSNLRIWVRGAFCNWTAAVR